MLFLAGLGRFLWLFVLLALDLARLAWVGVKLLARPPRLVMNGRNIGRLPRRVTACIVASAWWGCVKGLGVFCVDLVSTIVGAFIRTGPPCARCGGYIEAGGCPCGYRQAAHRAVAQEGVERHPTSAQRERAEREAFAADGAKVNPHIPADYAARVGVDLKAVEASVRETALRDGSATEGVPLPWRGVVGEPPAGLVGSVDSGRLGALVFDRDGENTRRASIVAGRVELAEAERDRPCDMIVNGIGPFPDPWGADCAMCGQAFGVDSDGAALVCLCKHQVIEWAPRAPTIPPGFDGSVTVDNPAGFVSVGT